MVRTRVRIIPRQMSVQKTQSYACPDPEFGECHRIESWLKQELRNVQKSHFMRNDEENSKKSKRALIIVTCRNSIFFNTLIATSRPSIVRPRWTCARLPAATDSSFIDENLQTSCHTVIMHG